VDRADVDTGTRIESKSSWTQLSRPTASALPSRRIVAARHLATSFLVHEALQKYQY
jgi:hypothetical protein